MQSLSLLPPVTFDHRANHARQRIAFRSGEVGFLVLGENRQNKDRQVRSANRYIIRAPPLLPRAPKPKRTLRIPPPPGTTTPHIGSAANRSTMALRSSEENRRSASSR